MIDMNNLGGQCWSLMVPRIKVERTRESNRREPSARRQEGHEEATALRTYRIIPHYFIHRFAAFL